MKLAIVDLLGEKTVLHLQGQNQAEHRQLLLLVRELRKIGIKNYTAAINIPRGYAGIAISL